VSAVALVGLLWRRAGARHRATLLLTAGGVAASVVLALLVVSVAPALDARAGRSAWQWPVPAGGEAAARQLTRTGTLDGRPLTIVHLAAVEPGRVPVPPGLDAFPLAGEVYLSPALADLLPALPPEAWSGRLPGTVVGVIGEQGLGASSDLVAVVGRDPDDLADATDPASALTPTLDPSLSRAVSQLDPATWAHYGASPGIGIDRFSTVPVPSDDLDTYRTLARMAAVLLVVPTVLLIGAAARLTAAQRTQRLATLRLAGATPGTVLAMTAAEIGAAAMAGTIVGVVGYLIVLPAAAQIPLAGGRFLVDDLRLGAGLLAGVLVAVPALAVATASAALRGAVAGPLGATRRSAPRRPSLLRWLVVPVAWVVFVWSAFSMRSGGSSTPVMVGLAAVVATLATVGPWIAWMIGHGLRLCSRRASTLIAARRILDDPRGAYRTVSGMVLAGLIAGFLFGVLPSIDAVTVPDQETLMVDVVGTVERQPALEAAVRRFEPVSSTSWEDVPGGAAVWAMLEVPRADIDALQDALVEADANVAVRSTLSEEQWARTLLDDLGLASRIMSLAALAMAVAASGIAGAAAILDQRLTLARLRLVGTPLEVLQRARRWQTVLPLALSSGGAMAFGAAAGIIMLLAFGAGPERLERPDVPSMAVLFVVSLVAGIAVVAATRPLLASVSRTTPRE
jgi:hypothetical protein